MATNNKATDEYKLDLLSRKQSLQVRKMVNILLYSWVLYNAILHVTIKNVKYP